MAQPTTCLPADVPTSVLDYLGADFRAALDDGRADVLVHDLDTGTHAAALFSTDLDRTLFVVDRAITAGDPVSRAALGYLVGIWSDRPTRPGFAIAP